MSGHEVNPDGSYAYIEWASAERGFERRALPSPNKEAALSEVKIDRAAGLDCYLASRGVVAGPWRAVE